MHPSRRIAHWFVPVWALAAVFALGWVPYQIPVTPNFGDSYLFCFNNRAGVAVVALFGLGIAFFAPGFTIPVAAALPEKQLQRSTLWKALLGTFVLGVTLFLLTRKLGGIDESVYLIDRVKLVLEGRVVNRDFEWPYGVFPLYGPVLTARWLHLPAADAYGIFWILLSLAGVWLLHATLRLVGGAFRLRAVFLLLLGVAWLAMLCTGANYSLFRFMLPCFLGLQIERRLRNGQQVSAILLIVPCYAALLLVSPELALSFGAGATAYVMIFGRLRTRLALVTAVAAILLMAIATFVAARLGTFLTLSAFSSGGFNFPVIAGPHILLFLLAIALCSAYAGRQLRMREPSPLLMLILVSGASIAGALGRCDAGHVFLDPMGVTVAALLLGSTSSRAGRSYFAATACIFLLLPLALSLAKLGSLAKFATQSGAGLQIDDVDRRFSLPHGTIVEVPFGIATSRFGTLHSPEIDRGYYLGLTDVLIPAAVDHKIAELAAHPARPLLLPQHFDDNCRMDADLHRRFLSLLFLYPYKAPVRHPESIYEPLCRYIPAHYELAQPATLERFSYEVWQPR